MSSENFDSVVEQEVLSAEIDFVDYHAYDEDRNPNMSDIAQLLCFLEREKIRPIGRVRSIAGVFRGVFSCEDNARIQRFLDSLAVTRQKVAA